MEKEKILMKGQPVCCYKEFIYEIHVLSNGKFYKTKGSRFPKDKTIYLSDVMNRYYTSGCAQSDQSKRMCGDWFVLQNLLLLRLK